MGAVQVDLRGAPVRGDLQHGQFALAPEQPDVSGDLESFVQVLQVLSGRAGIHRAESSGRPGAKERPKSEGRSLRFFAGPRLVVESPHQLRPSALGLRISDFGFRPFLRPANP